jgi:hypothetical protein
MGSSYLFRIDGARDNDEFFETMRPSMSHVYAGVDLRIGAPGWIPDLVKIEIDVEAASCKLTLIELEATETVALVSCRKYLPESSELILAGFSDYLERVIKQCRSTADPRHSEFVKLKDALLRVERVQITTAGALRNSTRFVEELSLLDQPRMAARQLQSPAPPVESSRRFNGVLRLSADDAYALSRCILVLDALARKADHSTAAFRSWRGQVRSQPLKKTLVDSDGSYPALRAFVLRDANYRGLTLDIEPVLAELVELWVASGVQDIDRNAAVAFIESYFSVALEMPGEQPMTQVFEAARKHFPR